MQFISKLWISFANIIKVVFSLLTFFVNTETKPALSRLTTLGVNAARLNIIGFAFFFSSSMRQTSFDELDVRGSYHLERSTIFFIRLAQPDLGLPAV